MKTDDLILIPRTYKMSVNQLPQVILHSTCIVTLTVAFKKKISVSKLVVLFKMRSCYTDQPGLKLSIFFPQPEPSFKLHFLSISQSWGWVGCGTQLQFQHSRGRKQESSCEFQVSLVYRVPVHPELHCDTLSPKSKQKPNIP